MNCKRPFDKLRATVNRYTEIRISVFLYNENHAIIAWFSLYKNIGAKYQNFAPIVSANIIS